MLSQTYAADIPQGTVGRGLTYWSSDPYAALAEAKRQRKLLLVEFYADWSHRSRWMSEHVLGDSSVRKLIERHFVAVQVPTGTPDGADLAELYQVTGYPAIVIFNASGDVLDKIDTTLDAEDFEQRIRAILMAMQGAEAWKLRIVYAAAERSDAAATDAAVEQFLDGQLPQDVANSVVWPMFENSTVMRCGSTAFDYLVSHVELFRKEIGRETVDAVLTETLFQSMLPYVVGSLPYRAETVAEMVHTAERIGLSSVLALQSMADVAVLRGGDDLSLFVARLGLLLDMLPEAYLLPLAVSLDIVAERGSRDAKAAAAKIVNRVQITLQSPSNTAMLERLGERLK